LESIEGVKGIRRSEGSPWPILLYMIPLFGLYAYVINDALSGDFVDRVGGALMAAIVVVVVVCGILTRMRAAAMYYVFLQAAVLQTFTMMMLILLGWRTLNTTMFITSFLIVGLLLVARVCRRIAWLRSA
jgi:hypothetical protein